MPDRRWGDNGAVISGYTPVLEICYASNRTPTSIFDAVTRMTETPKQRGIETLQLLMSKAEQLEYRRSCPMADVSAELFCDDVFWPDDAKLRTEFSDYEWTALLRFHSIFERVCRLLPNDPLPP